MPLVPARSVFPKRCFELKLLFSGPEMRHVARPLRLIYNVLLRKSDFFAYGAFCCVFESRLFGIVILYVKPNKNQQFHKKINKKLDAIKSRNIESEQGRRAKIEVQKVLEMMVSGEPLAPSRDSLRRSKSLKTNVDICFLG